MRAIRYHGHRDMRVDQVDDPKVQDPTDAVVRIERTAICGSDLHLYHGPGSGVPEFTMGHEFLGVVEDVGADVRRVKRGDRVLVSCTIGGGPLNPSRTHLKERVLELSHGLGADCAVEAVGNAQLVRDAIDVVRPGGHVSVVGVVMEPEVQIPLLSQVMGKNLTFRSGIVNPQRYIPELMPLIESGRLDPTEIITHRMSLDEGVRGYEIFDAHEDDVLKVVLTP